MAEPPTERHATGRFRPEEPTKSHSHGFDQALEDALENFKSQYLGPAELESPQTFRARIRFELTATAYNPVDVGEYRIDLDEIP